MSAGPRYGGFATAVFRIGDLVEPTLGAVGKNGVLLTITDPAVDGTIYQQSGARDGGGPVWTTKVAFAGREWSLLSEPDILHRHADNPANLIFLPGLLTLEAARKQILNIFAAADTPDWRDSFDAYVPQLPFTSWDDLSSVAAWTVLDRPFDETSYTAGWQSLNNVAGFSANSAGNLVGTAIGSDPQIANNNFFALEHDSERFRFRIDPTNVGSGSFEIDYILTGKRSDFDEDGISDADEGIATMLDSDNDGLPDFADSVPVVQSSAYEDCLSLFPTLTGTDRTADADPDKDGARNGIEFLMGTAPDDPASRQLPLVFRNAGGELVVTFTRSEAAMAYAVSVQHGMNLQAPWSAIAVPLEDTPGPPVTVSGNDITVIVPADARSTKFARVAIEIP